MPQPFLFSPFAKFKRAHSPVCKAGCCLLSVSLWMATAHAADGHHAMSRMVYSDHQLTSGQLAMQALASNAGLQAQRFDAAASKKQIDVVDRFDDPTFSYTIAPRSIGSDIGTRQIVQFSQPIPWPGKLDVKTDVSKAQAQVQLMEVDRFQQDLVRNSRSHWAMWWYLHQALDVNRDNQKLLDELQSVVATQYASGLGLQQDFLQVQTQFVHIRHQEVVLIQQIKRLRSQINGLLGLPANRPLSKPAAFPPLPMLAHNEDLQTWLVSNNPDLKRLRASSDAAVANMKLADADDYPDLRLNATWNDLLEPDEKHLQLGVSVNLPFSFQRRAANKSVQKYRYQSASAAYDDGLSLLQARLVSTVELVNENQSIVSIYQAELIPKIRQTLEAAKADYQAGRGEFANVVRAEQQLLSAQLELANSRKDQFESLASISALTGGVFWPLPDSQTFDHQPNNEVTP